MHEFRWNGGGEYKGKPWADHLPTDAAVSTFPFRQVYRTKIVCTAQRKRNLALIFSRLEKHVEFCCSSVYLLFISVC